MTLHKELGPDIPDIMTTLRSHDCHDHSDHSQKYTAGVSWKNFA